MNYKKLISCWLQVFNRLIGDPTTPFTSSPLCPYLKPFTSPADLYPNEVKGEEYEKKLPWPTKCCCSCCSAGCCGENEENFLREIFSFPHTHTHTHEEVILSLPHAHTHTHTHNAFSFHTQTFLHTKLSLCPTHVVLWGNLVYPHGCSS